MPYQQKSGDQYRRDGAVWPRGRELNDARKRPTLHNRDGSLAIMPGSTGTEMTVYAVPDMLDIEYNSTTQVFTVTCNMWLWNYTAPTPVRDTFKFNLPVTDTEIIRFWHLPYIYLPLRTGDASVIFWEGVASTPVASDTGTEEAEKLTDVDMLDISLCDLYLYADGTFAQQKPWNYTMRPIDFELLTGNLLPHTRKIPHMWTDMMPPPNWWYDETNKSLYCSADPGGEYGKVGESLSVAVPVSTTDATVYLAGSNGGYADNIVLSAPGATSWYLAMGTISTDGDGRLTAIDMTSWYTVYEATRIPRGGLTTSFVNGSGDTVTVTNGLITGIS